MLRDVLQKLTSKRGASLSMGLMLLLVCTTVAGVALTAATVVAGRQAKTKEMDKSYYNVTSAAKLYWDEMKKNDNLVVKVERSCTIGADGKTSWDCKVGETNVAADPISNTNASLFELASYDYLFDYTAETLDFATHRKLDNASQGITWTPSSGTPPVMDEIDSESVKDCTYEPFDVTPTGALADHFKPVHVTVKRKQANTYEFEFSDKSGSNNTHYECTLTAALLLGGGEFTPVKDAEGKLTGYTATSTLSWTPLSMEAGRNQQ